MDFRPADAILHGAEIQVEGSGDLENIGFWTNPADWIEWQFKAVHIGKYTLTAEVASPANPSITISFNAQKLHVDVPNTGSYMNYKAISLGTIEVTRTGKMSLSVRAEPKSWQPFNLRSIRMAPVRNL